jgi:hypothetical protein
MTSRDTAEGRLARREKRERLSDEESRFSGTGEGYNADEMNAFKVQGRIMNPGA